VPYSDRVLILAPTENDSKVTVRVLEEAGLNSHSCEDIFALCQGIQEGCAVIVVAEEALSPDQVYLLRETLEAQKEWSDIPVILLASRGPMITWENFSASGNISILERPFSRLTLIRAVEVGIRSRKRQYLVRDLIDQQRLDTQKRDEFFATLSHELRTPLNVILGWIEILRSGELNADEEKAALTVLERNARVQKSLIDDLLDTSRIITGKLHFESVPVSISDLIKVAQSSFAPRIEEKRITLTVSMPEENCMVWADEQRLSQVISNLLTNAIKFTSEGGKISVSLKAHEGFWELSVKDSGQGIEPSFLPYVFDRLKQEDMSTTRTHGGLGLGLSIVAHIVEQHKGKIEVRSEGRGKGAEFIVRIPALPTAKQVFSPPEAPVQKENSLEGVKVLVVDDSPDILQLVNLWLKKAKADVHLTGSAAEALHELPLYKPDVILSDIGMPEMDGYEFISKVRSGSDPKLSKTQAVALTAYAKDEERTKALQAGFQMHISKPISNRQLVHAISQLLRN
jgi:signal transduction histidine kinase/ActR/RegA family two-component response regulator